jgi:hypothetical protein
MTHTMAGHFDGKVIVPEKPVRLPVGKRLRIRVELEPPNDEKRPRKPRKIIGTGQFCSGVPDLATNKEHLEGFGAS